MNKSHDENRYLTSLSLLISFFVAFFLSIHATAQTDDTTNSVQSDLGLEEIIVTAQRRSESLQETPISINAISSEELDKTAPFDNVDLALGISNFNVRNTGRPVANVFIRGVGNSDFNQNTAASVGTYVDEVFIASTVAQNVPVYDLERVEVLKGPQGTLYGANTSGGALNYISKKPDLNGGVNGSASMSYGNFNERILKDAIGVPLIEDTLAMRVATISNSRDGTSLNTFTGSDISARDEFGGRLQILYRPNDRLNVLASATTRQRDADSNTGTFRPLIDSRGLFGEAGANRSDLYERTGAPLQIDGLTNALGAIDPDPDLFVNASNFNAQKDKIDDFIGSLRVDYDFENFTLTSISAVVDEDASLRMDSDFSSATILDLALEHKDEQFSQEFRLASNGLDNLDAVLGFYYLDRSIDVDNNFNLLDAFVVQQRYVDDTESVAIFGQVTYELNERLSLTAGLRYTEDDKAFVQENNAVAGTLLSPGAPLVNLIPRTRLSNKDEVVSGRLAIDYRVSDDVLMYASASRGYRAGGVTGGELFTNELLQPYDPEVVNAFEIGAKTAWLDNRLTLNAAAFYYDYEDLQVFLFRPTFVDALGIPGAIQQTTNASQAEVYGAELEANAFMTDNLRFNLGVGFLESEYQDFVDPITSQDLSGNELTNAPKWDVNAGLVYRKDLANNAELEISGSVSYLSSHYTDQSNLRAFQIDDNALANFSIAYIKGIGDSTVRFELWGKNIFDSIEPVDFAPVRGFGYDLVWFNDPATYGIKVAIDFNGL